MHRCGRLARGAQLALIAPRALKVSGTPPQLPDGPDNVIDPARTKTGIGKYFVIEGGGCLLGEAAASGR